MAKCKNCQHLKIDSATEKKVCFLIGEIESPDEEISCCCYRPATNADRIRSMTDEELAEFLSCDCDDVINCKDCKEPVNEYGSCSGLCRYEYLRWLKSEVGCE